MGTYTDYLEDYSYTILEHENVLEELKKIAKTFRSFDQALDSYLLERGYMELCNIDDKVRFLSDLFKAEKIPVPRNIKAWFEEHKRINRKTAFLLCFAFKLDFDEAEDFLRRICLERSFDCHHMEEVVYYYAFKHHLGYKETMKLLEQIEVKKPGTLDWNEVVYTEVILQELDDMERVEELVIYLNENREKFSYNHATAYASIKALWEEIAKEQGLSVKERDYLYVSFDKEKRKSLESDAAKTERKVRKRMEDSLWEIYLQILGLSGDFADEIYKGRSLKKILKDNDMLHPLAEESFPDREGLNLILNGAHVSYERVRKLLILLVFYRYWVTMALKKGNYSAENMDLERCMWEMNHYLSEAGYPYLYLGNPYDFIFIFCLYAEERMPLITFRDYMREAFRDKIDD